MALPPTVRVDRSVDLGDLDCGYAQSRVIRIARALGICRRPAVVGSWSGSRPGLGSIPYGARGARRASRPILSPPASGNRPGRPGRDRDGHPRLLGARFRSGSASLGDAASSLGISPTRYDSPEHSRCETCVERAGLSAPLVLAFAWGCGDSPPSVTSSKTEATVKGAVTIDGKPATAGSIVFDSSNISRPDAKPAEAPIGKDGTYSVKTFTGENQVKLKGNDLIKARPELQYERRTFNVQSGENTFNFEVVTKK